jgi:hypothetical protein
MRSPVPRLGMNEKHHRIQFLIGTAAGVTCLALSLHRGVKGNRITYCSPNLQAYIERWILTIRLEYLNHFIVLGERHLNFLIAEFVRHYQVHRPHQGVGNVLLTESPAPPESIPMKSELRCEQLLGGLLKHYHRQAA